jgi:glycosyltransferase involved in cell wall biosynthesis
MSRIVLISDSPNINTGYGVASHNLGRELRKLGHDICFIGFVAAGAPTFHKLDSEEVPIYEGNTTVSIEKAFLDWKPDVAIHIRDAFVHSSRWHSHPYSLVNITDRPKIILYTPIQSDNLPDEFVQACINECDFCVTFTKWGSDVLLFQGVPSNRMSSIWLGFDPEIFKPLDVKKEEYGFSENRPLIGSIGIADQYRKGWPILLQAFSIAKNKFPDLDMYLGTSPEGHYSLTHHADKLGVKGSIIYPQRYDKNWGLSSDEMAGLYNSMDAYVSTSIAEGFNLPLLEAFACGVPVICTDLPNHREILGDAAFFIPSRKQFPTAWSFEWLADPESAAELIAKALTMSSEEKQELRSKQLERSSELTWKRSAENWDSLLKRLKL